MEIGFGPMAALPEVLDDWRPDLMISIASPGMVLPTLTGVEQCVARFHDIEKLVPGLIAPDLESLTALRRHVEDKRPRRLFVHCYAGLSRSPAVALALRLWSRMEWREALTELYSLAPGVQPNRRILAIAAYDLGPDGAEFMDKADALFPPRPRGRLGVSGALGSAVFWPEAARAQ